MGKIKTFRKLTLPLLLILFFLCVSNPAHVYAESVQIIGVSPTGAISPGTPITFSTAATGFTDPTYVVSDSFSASGSTVGSIDVTGYFTWTPSVYDAGSHTVTITVTDKQSHIASSSTSILIASNSVVSSKLSPGPVVAVGQALTFSVVAPGFTNPSYSVYDSYWMGGSVSSANINSSGAFSWTPNDDDVGDHTITVTARDAYGHSAQTVNHVTVLKPAIVIQWLKSKGTGSVGSLISFSANKNSFNNPTYALTDSFTGTSTINATNLSPSGIFTWSPMNADVGYHAVVISATDEYGNVASSTVGIFVTAATQTTSATVQAGKTADTVRMTTYSSSSTTSSGKKYVFTSYLGIGSKGTAVLELQKRLTALGIYSGPISGYFGAQTSASVRKFQSSHGITPLGVVGPATRAVLNT